MGFDVKYETTAEHKKWDKAQQKQWDNIGQHNEC